MPYCDAILTPAEYQNLSRWNLPETACVVFDILRATTSMVTALANGASAIIPVAEISEAMAARAANRDLLLAGERHGLRIGADLTGGVEFDLGNSPREFLSAKVLGKTIAMTTTNGTRALKACQGARRVWVGSFLNLQATARAIMQSNPKTLLLVCSGTGEQSALEDTLAAGAMFKLLEAEWGPMEIGDSVHLAALAYEKYQADLMRAMPSARNGRRLLELPDLREDVGVCLQRDLCDFAVQYGSDGRVVKI